MGGSHDLLSRSTIFINGTGNVHLLLCPLLNLITDKDRSLNMHMYEESIEQFISNLIKIPIELMQPKAGCWIVVPKDRKLLQSKLWRELRIGALSGVGKSSVEAAVLLARAFGATGPRRVSPRHRARFWLETLLNDFCSHSVEEIKQRAQADLLPWSSVDRAARDLCIKRKKCGFRNGWSWQMLHLSESK
jgi:hypothetical protein